ncbi:MAG TPA: dicarboxylate/amino acid:cation symporter, partial [Bacteroidales bacterium]|nr:dicarboxylate/amino acid:cation symporter [Bacteroidales bacterium]
YALKNPDCRHKQMIGLMITLYIAIDSFGTACNVTGDGAIALIIDKISKKKPAAA